LLDPIAERLPVPIIGGVNRGRWWSLASAGAGYATGRRAALQMDLIRALVDPGDVVWDVGAHHGYVTLCAAARAGDAGRIHAFEPSARNRRILERHVRWNRMSRVGVHAHALSSFEGESMLGGGPTSKSNALGQDGGELVSVRTGASLIASGECRAPSFLKLDVEGEEGAVVEGLGRALPLDARLLIAVHTAEADRRCEELLLPLGFRLLPSTALTACRGGDWNADPDLLCLGPDYSGRRRVEQMIEGMAGW
jgi:FkbM family methyltransferase